MNLESDYNKVVYTEGEFSIRIGNWHYFITHDPCNVIQSQMIQGVAYDCTVEGLPITEGACDTCDKQYSKEMGGFIQLLVWEK